MENGVLMQYFEWYLSPEPHLWTLLKKDALHLKEIGITAVGCLRLLKELVEFMM